MQNVYLLLGTNLGNRLQNLLDATRLICNQCGPLKKTSSIYESVAWGYTSTNSFYNAVLHLSTALSPFELLDKIKHIEKQLGRSEKQILDYEDRLIDIDILFVEDLVIDQQTLQIPHPRLHLRLFTLAPLRELNGNLIHPLLNKNVSQLFDECVDENATQIIYHSDWFGDL
ncbi:MAG: 2-amino-4-hydroxy-6-hydroxymethyldihydropteridine diphosphokinase [Flavobacteriales bacterium]